MKDWKDRLREVVQGQERPPETPDNIQEARNRIANFIDNVVIPAFEELKAEMDRMEGRSAEIRRTDNQASLTVHRDGTEEFSFVIRGRSYHQLSAGFPQITRDDLPMTCKAEIVLYSGSQGEYPIDEFNHENILEAFIREYEKWGRWGTP